jgi:hypothetical protein
MLVWHRLTIIWPALFNLSGAKSVYIYCFSLETVVAYPFMCLSLICNITTLFYIFYLFTCVRPVPREKSKSKDRDAGEGDGICSIAFLLSVLANFGLRDLRTDVEIHMLEEWTLSLVLVYTELWVATIRMLKQNGTYFKWGESFWIALKSHSWESVFVLYFYVVIQFWYICWFLAYYP